MDGTPRLAFGVLVTPFHPVDENPTVALARDLELIEWVERLGFDEAWVGEHHSGGWGTIASPEVFLAHAAARTSRIGLGTGVVSLPYHHPLMVADRMVLLDHLTRGRVMFGVGSGALPSDAHALGIEQGTQYRRMEESLDAVHRLFLGDEPVTVETDWFSLRDAALQLRPYTRPHMELAVASSGSPAGMILAARYGAGMLSLAGFSPRGLGQLGEHWNAAEQAAEMHGQHVDRRSWRIVVPVHVAPTREQAVAEIREGGRRLLVEHFHGTLGRPLPAAALDGHSAVDAMIASGGAIVGDPDDCTRAIDSLYEITGGFGSLIAVSLDWAPRAEVWRSFEMLARYVVPRFQGSLVGLQRSQERVAQARAS